MRLPKAKATRRILLAPLTLTLVAYTSVRGDPTWMQWGLDSLSVSNLHQAGDYLYATAYADGVWRRYLPDADSTWVSRGLSGLFLSGVWANADGDTIYVSDESLDDVTAYRSVDNGPWVAISDPSQHPSGTSGACAVAASRWNAATVLLGGCQRGMIRSVDAGASWSCVEGCMVGTGAGRISRIVRSPVDPNEVWAVANSAFFLGSLLRSQNDGLTWSLEYFTSGVIHEVSIALDGTVIANDGPAIIRKPFGAGPWEVTVVAQWGIQSVEFGKWGSDLAVAGAFGEDSTWAWLSQNGGASWAKFEDGLTGITWTGGNSPRVRALESDIATPGVFFAAIDQNGVWRVQIDGVVSTDSAQDSWLAWSPVRLLRNPARREALFEVLAPLSSATVFDSSGRLVRRLPTGQRELLWDGRTTNGARSPDGVYFLSVESRGRRVSTRFVWLR